MSSQPTKKVGRPAGEVDLSRRPSRIQRMAIAIRKLREEAKLTVAKASSRAGISSPVWYRLERGAVANVREKTIQQVAKVLKTTPDDLDAMGLVLCAEKRALSS